MGCGNSSMVNGPVYTHMVRTFQNVITAMGMTKDEVDTLFRCWEKVDANKDAFMSSDEFHSLLGMKATSITKRIFAMLDRNNSGEVDFGEWLASIWIYLSYSRMSLIGLAFQLIDLDGNKTIDDDETIEYIKDMAASGMAKDRLVDWNALIVEWKTAVNVSNSIIYTDEEMRRAKKKGKAITEDIFSRYALKNPVILYGALHIQEVMREKIGGKNFWLKATERRAGKSEVEQVQQLYESIKIDVKQNLLLPCFISMKDGWLSPDSLAPNGDMERIRDIWARTFGAGKRALLLNRGESLRALNDARTTKKYGEKKKSFQKNSRSRDKITNIPIAEEPIKRRSKNQIVPNDDDE